jgi:hypothetical protein
VNATIPELVQAIARFELAFPNQSVGRLMVGGPFSENQTRARLADIRHRMGFRLFDYDEYLGALSAAHPARGRLAVLRGQFYGNPAQVEQWRRIDHAEMWRRVAAEQLRINRNLSPDELRQMYQEVENYTRRL